MPMAGFAIHTFMPRDKTVFDNIMRMLDDHLGGTFFLPSDHLYNVNTHNVHIIPYSSA